MLRTALVSFLGYFGFGIAGEIEQTGFPHGMKREENKQLPRLQMSSDTLLAEKKRIQEEYARRGREVSKDLYSRWQPATAFMLGERKRVAAAVLYRAGAFPTFDSKCLEVGCGSLGWLGDLITWGVKEENLHGIELDSSRAEHAREILPSADLRVGDASALPWGDGTFDLVIASTVFTSILDHSMRRAVAGEIVRVRRPGGALLWYDFKFNNPKNPHVKKVSRDELRKSFPQLRCEIRSVTLAPPLTRFLAPRSLTLATLLSYIPALRTHLLAVLAKPL